MNDLKIIIEVIDKLHNEISVNWLESLDKNSIFNYKKKTVLDVYNNDE